MISGEEADTQRVGRAECEGQNQDPERMPLLGSGMAAGSDRRRDHPFRHRSSGHTNAQILPVVLSSGGTAPIGGKEGRKGLRYLHKSHSVNRGNVKLLLSL